MSIQRCDRHGAYDTDFVESCPSCHAMTEKGTPRTDELVAYNMKNGAIDFSRKPIDLCRQLERELAAAQEKIAAAERRASLAAGLAKEECARICDQMQKDKYAKVPDGAWCTLGTVEISGHTFAKAIRATISDKDAVERVMEFMSRLEFIWQRWYAKGERHITLEIDTPLSFEQFCEAIDAAMKARRA